MASLVGVSSVGACSDGTELLPDLKEAAKPEIKSRMEKK